MNLEMSLRIRELRQKQGLTMKELAEKVGVTEQAISQYERNIRKPNFDMLNKIASALNVSVKDLIVVPADKYFGITTGIAQDIKELSEKNELKMSWEEIKGFTVDEFLEIADFSTRFIDRIITDRVCMNMSGADVKPDIFVRIDFVGNGAIMEFPNNSLVENSQNNKDIDAKKSVTNRISELDEYNKRVSTLKTKIHFQEDKVKEIQSIIEKELQSLKNKLNEEDK